MEEGHQILGAGGLLGQCSRNLISNPVTTLMKYNGGITLAERDQGSISWFVIPFHPHYLKKKNAFINIVFPTATFGQQLGWPLIAGTLYSIEIEYKSRISARGGGGGREGVRTPLSSPQGVISPPCWQRKWKYIPDFADISAKIDHFKYSNLKVWIFFSWLRNPTPIGPPPL